MKTNGKQLAVKVNNENGSAFHVLCVCSHWLANIAITYAFRLWIGTMCVCGSSSIHRRCEKNVHTVTQPRNEAAAEIGAILHSDTSVGAL